VWSVPVHSGSVASSPSKNTSSIVYGFFRSFSTRASSSSIAALDPPSFAPTKRNCRNSFVSKWPVIRMRSASAPGILTTTLAIFDVPSGVSAENCWSVGERPRAFS
jgi:hypothetical protein